MFATLSIIGVVVAVARFAYPISHPASIERDMQSAEADHRAAVYGAK